MTGGGLSEDRLAWIFGSSRSGSTWLVKMLSDLERVVPIDDPHLGHHLGVWRPIPLAWATGEDGDPPELRTLADFKRRKRDYLFSDAYRDQWMPALKELIIARFDPQVRDDAAARGIESPFVVVKEPASHVADWLLELFPSSRLIFLLRDGRDVVDSWLDAYTPGSWATAEGAYAASERGRLALVRWQATVWLRRTEVMQEVFLRHDAGRRVMVRYEAMRVQPAETLMRIASALGIGAGPREIAEIASRSSFERVPGSAKGFGHEVRRALPGGWRESMTAEEIKAMHRIIGAKLVELGYEDVTGLDRRAA